MVSTLLYAVLSLAFAPSVLSLDCYHCSSKNRSEISCEDPLPEVYSDVHRKSDCQVPAESLNGSLVPASFCVKILGNTVYNKESLLVRSCISGKQAFSQCGEFIFQNELMVGCMLFCEGEFCNIGSSSTLPLYMVLGYSILGTHLLDIVSLEHTSWI
ncbi:uncharacterized protein LOC111711315 [Eurytemora carolleeae]|uniref:uncharacterized protein LOC111711315 n=1 Tax=Eurytemora carolleeae TaxID=1294199 RepID=UPI000C764828|nr:uncharacterized protein LOC111711315 [Eurytemora carolleeae]|eukprot:XP_023341416.1 uncharacterized protein LOC111711315 [Eurytemora affinis]